LLFNSEDTEPLYNPSQKMVCYRLLGNNPSHWLWFEVYELERSQNFSLI